jgi:hypothetical protein
MVVNQSRYEDYGERLPEPLFTTTDRVGRVKAAHRPSKRSADPKCPIWVIRERVEPAASPAMSARGNYLAFIKLASIRIGLRD